VVGNNDECWESLFHLPDNDGYLFHFVVYLGGFKLPVFRAPVDDLGADSLAAVPTGATLRAAIASHSEVYWLLLRI